MFCANAQTKWWYRVSGGRHGGQAGDGVKRIGTKKNKRSRRSRDIAKNRRMASALRALLFRGAKAAGGALLPTLQRHKRGNKHPVGVNIMAANSGSRMARWRTS